MLRNTRTYLTGVGMRAHEICIVSGRIYYIPGDIYISGRIYYIPVGYIYPWLGLYIPSGYIYPLLYLYIPLYIYIPGWIYISPVDIYIPRWIYISPCIISWSTVVLHIIYRDGMGKKWRPHITRIKLYVQNSALGIVITLVSHTSHSRVF